MSETIISTEMSPNTTAQTQNPNPAQVKAPEIVAPAKSDDMAAKFASLAKKERIARLAQHNNKTKEQALAERERQIAERERLWEEEFKQTPLEAIKKRGYSYEDLTKAALNDGKFQPETEVKEIKSELERWKQAQAEKEKQALENQKQLAAQAEAQAIESFKASIGKHLEANKDKYELTALYEAEDLVFQTVEEHFARTKKILDLNEASGLVESYIESELERTATASKKFQAKYGGKLKEDPKASAPQRETRTLSNDLTPTSAAPSLLPAKTENDRLARAMAALEGRRS